MTNKTRTHIVSDDLSDMKLVPKHLSKQEFGRRLYRLMLEKGWTQSELARQADLPRDSISTYVRGKTLPTPHTVKKMAEALGMRPEELMPAQIEHAIDADNPVFEMKVSPSSPSMAWVRVNRLLPLKEAMAIAEILDRANLADTKRSGSETAMQ